MLAYKHSSNIIYIEEWIETVAPSLGKSIIHVILFLWGHPDMRGKVLECGNFLLSADPENGFLLS